MVCEWLKPKTAYLVARLGVVDALLPLGTTKPLAQLADELKVCGMRVQL
jgi:hypothetical protein